MNIVYRCYRCGFPQQIYSFDITEKRITLAHVHNGSLFPTTEGVISLLPVDDTGEGLAGE